jgi:hypothetical protein
MHILETFLPPSIIIRKDNQKSYSIYRSTNMFITMWKNLLQDLWIKKKISMEGLKENYIQWNLQYLSY